MNGADILCDTLLGNGVDVCFANPGTSEMHFVAALDRRPQMRCVLGLAEGVVTGAADGFGRMAERPAATLLHLGPGLGNGIANLHNARRAKTPIVNIVGDHASYHLGLDAPLTSDIAGLAQPVSDWVGRAASAGDVASQTREAIAQAVGRPGVATLILPADAAWSEAGSTPALLAARPERPKVEDASVRKAAEALRRGKACLILGGPSLLSHHIRLAHAISMRTGATVFSETNTPRIQRGIGVAPIERLPYPMEIARSRLAGFDTIVLAGARSPVSFFAYPGKESRLIADGCNVVELASPRDDVARALQRLADEVSASAAASLQSAGLDSADVMDGPLTAEAIAAIVARRLPENAIVCDEMLTSEGGFYAASMRSAPHDYLALTGGAIGIGIPLATGAAIAAPGRKVVSLQADGSGMYSVQGLWTQARERLDIVTVVFANRAYRILEAELRNVGIAEAGPSARRMLELEDPSLDWVRLAGGLGVQAERVETTARFQRVFEAALGSNGPFLIEAVI